jgi:hypothetical protein
MTTSLTQLQAEYRALLSSWEYAFAVGHGCSMGYMPTESRAVLQRADDLRARISEHEPGAAPP